MKNPTALLIAALTLTLAFAQAARADSLDSKTLKIENEGAEAALDKLAASPKTVFQNFDPQAPKGIQLIPGSYAVSGTPKAPQIRMKLCQEVNAPLIGVICPVEVGMVGHISFRPVDNGACDRRYQLSMDLSRSDVLVTTTYNNLNVIVCFNKGAGDKGTLKFDASVTGPKASADIAAVIRKFLNRQMEPITNGILSNIQASQKKAATRQKQAGLRQEDGAEPSLVSEGAEKPAA